MLLIKALLLFAPVLVRAIALPAEAPIGIDGNDDVDVSELHYVYEADDLSSGDGLGYPEMSGLPGGALRHRTSEDAEDVDQDDSDTAQLSLAPRQLPRGRDSPPPNPQAEAEFERARKLLSRPAGGLGLIGCRFNVDVYFKSWHYEPNPSNPTRKRSNGYIRDSDITAAMKSLNANFAGFQFQFTLKEHRRYYFDKKSDWDAQTADPDNTGPGSLPYRLANAKRPLDKRPSLWRRNLHVYIINDIAGGTFGFSSLAETSRTVDKVTDGVFFDQKNFDGGAGAVFPIVLTHEVGHWLGLLHTFEGGCKNLDRVDDTLAEEDLTDSQRNQVKYTGCPASGVELSKMVYSCPNRKKPTQRQLLASRQNFMSYFDPNCVNRFTPQQVDRMLDQSVMYRNFNFGFC